MAERGRPHVDHIRTDPELLALGTIQDPELHFGRLRRDPEDVDVEVVVAVGLAGVCVAIRGTDWFPRSHHDADVVGELRLNRCEPVEVDLDPAILADEVPSDLGVGVLLTHELDLVELEPDNALPEEVHLDQRWVDALTRGGLLAGCDELRGLEAAVDRRDGNHHDFLLEKWPCGRGCPSLGDSWAQRETRLRAEIYHKIGLLSSGG